VVDSVWGANRPLHRPADPVSPIPENYGQPGAKAARRRKAVPVLEQLPAPSVPTCSATTAQVAETVRKEAEALQAEANSLWAENNPDILERAGKLIRRAQALVESPLCQGIEKQAALADLQEAVERYRLARLELLAQESTDTESRRRIKQIAERVALSAAKAARSCARGQQKLDFSACSAQGGGKPPCGSCAEAQAKDTAGSTTKKPRKDKKQDVLSEPDAAKDAVLMNAVSGAVEGALSRLLEAE
jgi:hypothetical protein